MLVYQKTMFDLYYCIKSFSSLENFRKALLKFIFVYYKSEQKHEEFAGFENACSRAKTYVIKTSLNYVHFSVRYC